MNRASTTKSISCSSKIFNAFDSASARSSQGTQMKGNLYFFASDSKAGRLPMTMAGSALSERLATARERFKTTRFSRHQNCKALPPLRIGKTHLDLHPQRRAETGEAAADVGRVEFLRRPRCLKRHAELPACDLFLQRLDVGVLLKKKIGHARDDTGFVASDDGDGGEFLHRRPGR